jgi:hypothetical protein
VLKGIGGLALVGSSGIGVYASIKISLAVIPLVAFSVLIVLAYNLEFWRGRFHTDIWFATAWGALPALAGYFAQTGALRTEALIVAAACVGLSFVQRTLSNQCRTLRREVSEVSGVVVYEDGRLEDLTVASLLVVPERALRILSYTVPLLAAGWFLAAWT